MFSLDGEPRNTLGGWKVTARSKLLAASSGIELTNV